MSAVKTQVTPAVSELSPETPDSDQALSLPEDDTLSFPHDISPSVALVPNFAELICWSEASLRAPLNEYAFRRYMELFCRMFPEESEALHIA